MVELPDDETSGGVMFAARHVGDVDVTVAGDLGGARQMAYFNTGCEVVWSEHRPWGEWARFYGPESAKETR